MVLNLLNQNLYLPTLKNPRTAKHTDWMISFCLNAPFFQRTFFFYLQLILTTPLAGLAHVR